MEEIKLVEATKTFHDYGKNAVLYSNFIKQLYEYRKSKGYENDPVIIDLMAKFLQKTLVFDSNAKIKVDDKTEYGIKEIAAEFCTDKQMEVVYKHVAKTYKKQLDQQK